MRYDYQTKGTCSTKISFDIEGNVVKNVQFTGGCNGNFKAISPFVDGMTVEEIEKKLDGITCGWKKTSCSDQLANAVRQAYEESKNA